MMDIPFEYVLIAIVAAVLGFGAGASLTEPESRAAQWQDVYSTCMRTRDGVVDDPARRTECLKAAFRVMKCMEPTHDRDGASTSTGP